MARTKPDKIREETYDYVVQAMEKIGIHPIGRSKEGLVFENHLDGEHVVIKAIKKKNPVSEDSIEEILTYQEQIKRYEEEKQKK